MSKEDADIEQQIDDLVEEETPVAEDTKSEKKETSKSNEETEDYWE